MKISFPDARRPNPDALFSSYSLPAIRLGKVGRGNDESNRMSDRFPGVPDQRFRLASGKPTSVRLNGSSPEGQC